MDRTCLSVTGRLVNVIIQVKTVTQGHWDVCVCGRAGGGRAGGGGYTRMRIQNLS